ncbi:MAG TPA: trehalose-phosphatase [Luteimonas sp.]
MPGRNVANRPPPPAPADDWALFLDVDGCLLDLAEQPDAVRVPSELRHALRSLADRLEGALALVSGRPLAGLDALFSPLQFAGAGLHGLERRNGEAGSPPPARPEILDAVREEATRLAARFPGALVEDKGVALGLHWRGAPEAKDALRGFADATLPRLPGYRLQHGNHVVELRPEGGDKGNAIEALLAESPFRGRLPVFAGDDITDESGFAVVNARAGISVLVGDREPSAAHFALPGPGAVRRWLAEAVA